MNNLVFNIVQLGLVDVCGKALGTYGMTTESTRSSCHQQVDAEAKHNFNKFEVKQSGQYREPAIIGGCITTEPMNMRR